MGKNSDYAEQHAAEACEQMRRYGIPASVILAQAILESSSGQSQLARVENNHFGIKADKAWLASGGRYGLYTDDRPDEKFCSYDSVADSYEHHSQFLKNNSRYAACFDLAPDDYRGWAEGLDRAGYATAGQYAPALIAIIERNGLDRYDRMVMEEMAAQGLTPRQAVDRQAAPQAAQSAQSAQSAQAASQQAAYSFPLKREEFLFVTSPFGMRSDPLNPDRQLMHKGMDVLCDHETVLATETGGKVVAVNDNANAPEGRSVTVEYEREEGEKVQVTYAHLDSVTAKVGDTVTAGQQLGVTGNSGTRTTGEHLHIGVKQVMADGTARDIDPAAYLAEVAQRGNIQLQVLHNGNDLLAKYSPEQRPTIDTSLTPDAWMKKLLSSEDSGVALGGGQDPVVELAMTMFSSLMLLATHIDGQTEREQREAATQAALTKQVDLSTLVPAYRECTLTVRENDTPLLTVNDGANRLSIALTATDLNRLNLVLSDSSLSTEAKQQRVSAIIGNIALSAQLSQSYQQGVAQQQSQAESMQLK